MSKGWSQAVSQDEANRRAGGRRRYNAERQLNAWKRRILLVQTFDIGNLLTVHGTKAAAARFFGVSAATITRDVEAILRRGWWGTGFHRAADASRENKKPP